MPIEVTFVGTATTLIRRGGITVVTAPNFLHQGQRAYLGYGLWSKRRHPPALTPEQLPPIDAVVLSHLHGDHWDRVGERSLDRTIPVITTQHAAKRLRRRGFEAAVGLNTWDSHTLHKGRDRVTVSALPGRHAPIPVNHLLPPVMGSMLEFTSAGEPTPQRLYISGDTLLIDELAEIPVRFTSIDVGVLHLGGTRLPFGDRLPVGLTVTMDGKHGAEAAARLELPRVIPVHFDDYRVFASPLADFHREMSARGLADRIVTIERGQSVSV